MNRVAILKETLQIFDTGQIPANGAFVPIKLSPEEFQEAIYLPDKQIASIIKDNPFQDSVRFPQCRVSVCNGDSFTIAMERQQHVTGGNEKVLVLNFANPVSPGGGVRYGAVAQEEDLCRKSSLLCSLESPAAVEFYRYHKECCDCMSSHSMLLSPNVEIIRNANNRILPDSEVVSVLTCAAPIRTGRFDKPMSVNQYYKRFYFRILSLFYVAAHYGYRSLVLGAWGCGAFGNDAKVVAKLFKNALDYKCEENHRIKEHFSDITFAILRRPQDTYNYNCFSVQFNS